MFVQQTGLALQELLPTPMTEMGEHVKPTRTFKSLKTMPKRPASRFASAEVDYNVRVTSACLVTTRRNVVLTLTTELQHWMDPVLHSLTVVTVGAGAVTVTVTVGVVVVGTPHGVATARRETEKKT